MAEQQSGGSLANDEAEIHKRRRKTGIIFVLVVAVVAILCIGGVLLNAASGVAVRTYLRANGSVNTRMIDNVKDHVPKQDQSNFLSSMNSEINTAVSNHKITKEQGAALKQAFGIQ